MHKLKHFITYWCLSEGIKNILKKILIHKRKKIMPSELKKEEVALDLEKKQSLEITSFEQENIKFKNIHKGQRVFILATGPSVQKQNLLCLENEICIAVSQFFLHKDIKTIAPQYHVLAPWHPPFGFKDAELVFKGFQDNYSSNTTFFFGHTNYEYSIKNFLTQNPRLAPKNTYYLNYTNPFTLTEENYLDHNIWDLMQVLFYPRTVIYSAIQLALFMGSKEIYLIGCDHDYLLDTKRVSNHHFYKEEEGISDVEHLSAFTTERWFEEYYCRWKQYRLMKEYASLNNCQIINATEGGMLDVFPRMNLSQVCFSKKANYWTKL